MTTQDNKSYGNQPAPSPCDCKSDDSNPTQIVINTERKKYCTDLYTAKGNASQQETKYVGEYGIYDDRKCMFVRTEDNYRRYRNFEITIGTEMTTTSEAIKGNVDKLKKWNGDLYALLKKLNKSVKDVKAKFSDLKDAGCKLESSIRDKCFTAQWKALTGKSSEKCSEKPTNPHPDCANTSKVIEDLICIPKGLIVDIDSLFQSSADVVGIQVFSNIDTLEPLQKDLDTFAKAFEKQIADTMKTRETDLKNLQNDLVKSVKNLTKSAIDRNTLRSEFEGHFDAVSYMCCPCCDCVVEPVKPTPNPNDCPPDKNPNTDTRDCYCDCQPRLKDCEDRICKICNDVETAFCCIPDDPNKPKPKPCGCP